MAEWPKHVWSRIHTYLNRLVEASAATWAESRGGRSFSADYRIQSLSELLQTADVKALPLGRNVRYVITSDHHRKAPFMGGPMSSPIQIATHRALYEQALHFYADRNYTLIEAGDIEELWRLGTGIRTWMDAWDQIQLSYASVYQTIRESFAAQDRYVRLWGNHDAIWRLGRWRAKYLTPVLGEVPVHEMVLLGDRFLVMHGQAVDRWNNDRRGWWVGRVFSKSPFHVDAVTSVVADPDGLYPNWVGGRCRNDWLARLQNGPRMRKLLGLKRYHPVRAVECDPYYVHWARSLGVNLICGHTHEPAQFPFDPEGNETPYLNCGSGLGAQELQMMEIMGDGTPIAVKWTAEGRFKLCFKPTATVACRDGRPREEFMVEPVDISSN